MRIAYEWNDHTKRQWRFRDMPDLLRQIPGAVTYTTRDADRAGGTMTAIERWLWSTPKSRSQAQNKPPEPINFMIEHQDFANGYACLRAALAE